MTYEEMVLEILDFLQQECDNKHFALAVADGVAYRLQQTGAYMGGLDDSI